MKDTLPGKRRKVKRDREGKRNTEPEHQLLLQTPRDPPPLPKSPNLNPSFLAANYSSNLVEMKFMTPSWRSVWHHKLNWQRVLDSKARPPVLQQRGKNLNSKESKPGCSQTRLYDSSLHFSVFNLVFSVTSFRDRADKM